MGKLKLLKRPSGQPQKSSKTLQVEDKSGNKSILKATVIQVPIKKEFSNEITEEFEDLLNFNSRIIAPPLALGELAILREYSSELGQNLDAMAIGIDGFGVRLHQREMLEAHKKHFSLEIEGERKWLQTNAIDFPNPNQNLKSIKKELRHDIESTGNGFLELIPGLVNTKYSCYNRLDISTMRITKQDNTFTRIRVKYIDENFNIKEKTFLKKLRRYVQIVGSKAVYFKEFMDNRIIDSRSGNVSNEKLNKKYHAREVYHFKKHTSRRTPYGIPSFAGNIIAIKGSRSADEANILTQQNNNVPSLAVLVSGGMLTGGSIQRIQEFVDTSIKGDLNYSKFLILEGESNSDGLSGASSMKIEIQPLTNNQHTDALWKEYDDANASKIRRSFRQPSLLTGDTSQLSRSTAQESERLAEKYVYNPLREDSDDEWNRILVQQGIRFWFLKSNSPNVTNDEDLVKIITGGEKTGGITPRISRMLLEDILNRELPPIKENDDDFDPDLPFSLSLAKLARGMGEANAEGTFSPQGQIPKEENDPQKLLTVDNLHQAFSGDFQVDKVFQFLERFKTILEKDLDQETFEGKDYFKNVH